MFLASWSDLVRVVTVGTLAYIALVLILRISGKRTLTKLNAFDLVITVALGSTLATIVLNKSVSLAEGVAALALLVFLQLVITWTSVRSRGVQRLIKAQPALLFYKGMFLAEALRAERVTRDEILAAIRSSGIDDVAQVGAVVLETDGSLSVLSNTESEMERSALSSVRGVEKAGR
jgi:uncharacterized membrane protein YcaP (DUF421 family)